MTSQRLRWLGETSPPRTRPVARHGLWPRPRTAGQHRPFTGHLQGRLRARPASPSSRTCHRAITILRIVPAAGRRRPRTGADRRLGGRSLWRAPSLSVTPSAGCRQELGAAWLVRSARPARTSAPMRTWPDERTREDAPQVACPALRSRGHHRRRSRHGDGFLRQAGLGD
jgi:hypothetical protein